MKNQDLFQLFVDELADIKNAESQLIDALPRLIEKASLEELKHALEHHLKETRTQVVRIEKIFTLLNISPVENVCEAMQGLVREAKELIEQGGSPSATLDAAIISAAQKIEHYEIATYGTLKSFAKHLNFDSEVIDLLQDSEDEEAGADKKLTKIADGSLFFGGVNKEAAAATSAKNRY
jgi:ferritin-like metal-binding protein YciE